MLIRSLVCSVIGILGGGLGGALILGWDTALDMRRGGLLGPPGDWWPLAAYFGGLGGAVCGLCLGLYISLAQAGIRWSVIAGVVVGIIGVMVLLSLRSPLDTDFRSLPSQVAPLMLSVIVWALISFVLSLVSTKLSKIHAA